MPSTIQNKLQLFADNTQAIKGAFPWQNHLTKRLAALLYALEDRSADCSAIGRCHDLMKQSTSIFSVYRGDMALCIATLLSLSPSPQARFDDSLRVYGQLKATGLYSSNYLAVAAYQIASQSAPEDFPQAVARTRAFYDGMKAHHFFRTGQDDYIFAAMLGLSDLDLHAGTARIEELSSRLKGEFWDKNSIQTLAQVLVLGSSGESALQRLLALRDTLRRQGIRLDKTYTLPFLGVLALLPAGVDTLARSLDEAQRFLRTRKGYGAMWVSSQELLLYASAAVAAEHTQQLQDGMLTAALSTGITNILIAQQTAMIAAASASSAAASSS